MTGNPVAPESGRSDRAAGVQLGPDPELWWLANFAAAGGVSIKVTLVLGGSTITGVLISDGEFFELLADAFDAGKGKKSGPARFAGILRGKAAERTRLDSSAGRTGATPDVWHIHLRDARIWSLEGGARTLGLWRGRLSEVSGWSLESLV